MRSSRYVLNILIVDDDVTHGRSVRDLLSAHNYDADVAISGKEGLAKLKAAHDAGAPVTVLILDLHIPDLSGLEVLQAIGDAHLKCKTIVLSGERALSSVTPILKHGAVDYMPKPFVAEQLINAVLNAQSRYELERDNARMHREAEDNAKLYRFLLNASPDLIYMLDPDGRFQFINERLNDIFDCDQSEVIGQPWARLFDKHPALTEQLGHQINERRSGVRATLAQEFDFTSDLGSQHSLELSSIGLYETCSDGTSGEFLGTYGVIRDVTESKRTRRQLAQSQRKFYSLFVDSPDAVFISNLESGHISERNPQFVAFRDAAGVEHHGTDHFLWTEEQPRSAFIADLEANPSFVQWDILKDLGGEDRHLEVRGRKIEIEGEACLIATLRDRTEERRAEQDRLSIQRQLQQAGRMEAIGQVAGGIAHDFNNILASIIGYAELVLNARSRLDEHQVNQYLNEVVTAGHRARDLISQMLNFTRAQRGEGVAIDVVQTVSDVSRMLRAAIPSTIDLKTEFSEFISPVAIEATQLQQIVINLLINARDAITGNGVITVKAANEWTNGVCQTCGEAIDGEQVTIRVQDTGHGIPDEILDKIFQMHFTTRDPDKGTGFGLWMIDKLVHDHDGHLSVQSTPDTGTEFTIHLPAERRETVSDQVERPASPKIDGRILVVDDEVSVANFIGEVLRDKGYPTVVFTESPQALSYLQNNLDSVSLLLTDGTMPLISGVELAEYARANAPGLPIVFITAFTQNHDEQALEKIGVDRYLQKPFSIDEMISTVRELTREEIEIPLH